MMSLHFGVNNVFCHFNYFLNYLCVIVILKKIYFIDLVIHFTLHFALHEFYTMSYLYEMVVTPLSHAPI
jgi:hypothetical protein